MYSRGTLKLLNRSLPLNVLSRLFRKVNAPELQREFMDIVFSSPLGIASGFDNNADYYNAVSAMGFSFEVIGPLSFNTKEGSVKAAINKLKNNPARNIKLGINLTKQDDSHTEEEIARDILEAFAYCYDFVDFAVLNYSHNNFGAVNELAFINAITEPILNMRLSYAESKPIVLRLSPTLNSTELNSILDYCLMNSIDAVMLEGIEQISQANAFSKGRLPIIAILNSPKDEAMPYISAGACLVALNCTNRSLKPNTAKKILSTLKNK